MLQQLFDGIALADVGYAQIAEQRVLALAAPGAGLQMGESLPGVQVVLVAVQHKADLVQVVPVQLAAKDHVRKSLAHRHLAGVGRALAGGVVLNGALGALLKMLAGKQAVVAFQVKLQPAAVQPVHDGAAVPGGKMLVQHHRAAVLHIAAVAADHAVQPDGPQLRVDLGLAAAGADVDPVPVGPRGAHRLHGGIGQIAVVVHQRAVHIQENDFFVGHNKTSRSGGQPCPAGCCLFHLLLPLYSMRQGMSKAKCA